MSTEIEAMRRSEPPTSRGFEATRAALGPFASRLIEEALLAALPETWERRARDFDSVPLPNVAAACRDKAAFLRRYPDAMLEAVRDAVAETVSEERTAA